MCKPHASWSAQWQAAARKLLPSVCGTSSTPNSPLPVVDVRRPPLLAWLFYMIYEHELRQLSDAPEALRDAMAQGIGLGFVKVFAALVVVTAIVTWWIVLTHKSRQVAQEESNRRRRRSTNRRRRFGMKSNRTSDRRSAAASQAHG